MDDLNEYEKARLQNIADNQKLLDSLKLGSGSTSALGKRAAPAAPVDKAKKKKKKVEPTEKVIIEPKRRSARVLGLEADSETLKRKYEEEAAIAAEERRKATRARHGPYTLDNLPAPIPPIELSSLTASLSSTASSSHPKADPSSSQFATSSHVPDDSDQPSPTNHELVALKSAFEGLAIISQAKLTEERTFSMTIHPDPTKTLVFAGDKFGQLGIWDALAEKDAKIEEGEDGEVLQMDDGTRPGKNWKVRVHGQNSLSCMKVEPREGKKLFTSSYDCSIRVLDLEKHSSHEVFSILDDDALITNFDITPDGNELWCTDKHGGLSHADMREGGSRRRFNISDGKKLGGVSINPTHPNLICTAGNDQHLRIFDVRHLSNSNLQPMPVELEEEKTDPDVLPTYATEFYTHEEIVRYADTEEGAGLRRGVYRHGKSCSAAYWDPFGKRVLTTSYDDRLRVWDVSNQALVSTTPFGSAFGEPTTIIPHDCQTGRWLSIFRAQWAGSVNHYPHFTVGNMKRSLDVVAYTGEPIARLFDPEVISAVPAVTASHPSIVNHVVGGNGSGKCQLWGPPQP